jgi:hypothetical protein
MVAPALHRTSRLVRTGPNIISEYRPESGPATLAKRAIERAKNRAPGTNTMSASIKVAFIADLPFPGGLARTRIRLLATRRSASHEAYAGADQGSSEQYALSASASFNLPRREFKRVFDGRYGPPIVIEIGSTADSPLALSLLA